MNQMIAKNNNATTMSSLELVEFINRQRKEGEAVLAHSDFLKKVPQVLGEKDAGNFSSIYQDAYKRDKPCYTFPKREACLMAMSYSYELQAKVFDHMTALESQLASSAPALNPASFSRLQLIELAMQAEQERLVLAEQVEVLAPKAAALDRIATADGSLCLTDAAKELQRRPKDVIAWMSCNLWIYKRAGGSNWIGYQDRIQSGLLEHKSSIVIDAEGGERVRDQVRVTAKGLVRLSQQMTQEAAA